MKNGTLCTLKGFLTNIFSIITATNDNITDLPVNVNLFQI